MNWKKLFATRILERGYDYYCEGAVENLDVEDDYICADVVGSERYEVEINLFKGDVTDMNCSCPYAEDGNHCKHMAAVLYEWEDYDDEYGSDDDCDDIYDDDDLDDVDIFVPLLTRAAYEKKEDEIKELISKADVKDVQTFLTSLLLEDEKLLLRFRNLTNKTMTPVDVHNYICQVDNIADRYLGRDNFINYYRAGDFVDELLNLIDEDVCRMIENGNYLSAFEVMNHIFVLVGDVDMDDSDGGTSIVAGRIYHLWEVLLETVSATDKRKMFNWFVAHLDGSVIDYLEDYIEQIIFGEFDEPEYEQPKRELMEKKMKQAEHISLDWTREYEEGRWALHYLDMLNARGASLQEIEDVCHSHWKSSAVRKYYIDLCVDQKDYDNALRVLDDSLLLDKNYNGLVSEYSKRKKEIYLLIGDDAAYLNQLWQLVLDHAAGNLDIYRELKAQYDEAEWLIKREEVFKGLSKHVGLDPFYKEEKLYDRLLECVVNSYGLFKLQEYEKDLVKLYPKQVLDKYQRELNAMASFAGDRKRYAQMVALLRKMRKIKGGDAVVEFIVTDWKERYKKRPAMMDELGKL